MTNRKRSLLNLISAAVSQLIAIAIGFLLPRLFITNFGSEVNGLLSSANQILVYLALFEAGVGGVTLQALYGPIARKQWGIVNGILSATNIYYKKARALYLITLVAVAALYPLMVSLALPAISVSLIIFFIGIPQVISFYIQAKYILLLRADGKNYVLTNLTTVINTLTGLTKVVLILKGVDVLPVIIIQCLILLTQAVVLTRYTKKHYPHLSLDVPPDYPAISQKNYMLVHQISGLIFQNTDVLILTMIAGLKVVSVYSIYKLVMSQMGNLVYILQSSVDFILGQTFQTDKEKFARRIDQFESMFSGLTFSLYAVIFHILFAFVSLYTKGVEDIKYADYTLVLLFTVIELLTVMRTPMLQTINYAGHFKQTLPQSLVETTINLVVSLIAVAFLGIYGVLLGTIAALLYRTNDIIFYSNKNLLHRSVRRTYAIHCINLVLFVLIQFLFRTLFVDITNWTSLIKTTILASLISVPLFLAVQALVWPENRASLKYYMGNAGLLLKKFRKDKAR